MNAQRPAGGTADAAPLRVVYEDEWLVVVDKPAGLLAVPGRGPDKQDCLAARVRAVFVDALVVHRLDEATPGLMIFGRGLEAQRRLGSAFERRAVSKRYLAVVAGRPKAPCGHIDWPIGADWPNRPRQRVDTAHGRAASTHWQLLGSEPALAGCSRLELEPATGRSHQLRVHLAAIGHPIVGDALYAPPDTAAWAPRLLLHATRLAFDHPSSGSPLEVTSAAPF